jgi:hypothetical protein
MDGMSAKAKEETVAEAMTVKEQVDSKEHEVAFKRAKKVIKRLS